MTDVNYDLMHGQHWSRGNLHQGMTRKVKDKRVVHPGIADSFKVISDDESFNALSLERDYRLPEYRQLKLRYHLSTAVVQDIAEKNTQQVRADFFDFATIRSRTTLSGVVLVLGLVAGFSVDRTFFALPLVAVVFVLLDFRSKRD